MKKPANQKQVQKKKSHKKLWIILGIVAVVVIGLIVMAVRGLKNMTEQLATVLENTAVVETGEIAVTTEGIGVVEAADSTMVYADYNVTVRKLYKQNGEKAAAGEVIAEYDSIVLDDTVNALESQLAQIESQLAYTNKSGASYVTAPVSGRVKGIWAEKGESVLTIQQQFGALAVISADGNLKVVFTPEAEVVEGQKVTILYDDKVIEGRIQEASTYKATAVFEDLAEYDIEKETTVQAEDGTVLGRGVTECGHPILITADSGMIKSINVEVNEKVSAQATIFKLEDVAYSQEYLTLLEQREQLMEKISEAKEYKKGYTVIAENDCIVNDLTVEEGNMLAAGTPLCTLLDISAYQVVLDIDELDIQGIETEQPVEVTVDAIEDVSYQGTVSSVSMAGDNTNGVGTYKVTVLLEEAKELLPGMSANGKITMEHKTDALLVPIDTLQTMDGEKSVNVFKADGTYETRKVTVGLVNNDYAEILEGVQEGEELQVIMKLEDIYSQMGITVEETDSVE